MTTIKISFVLLLSAFVSMLAKAQTDTAFWFVAPDCTWPGNAAANTESPMYLRFTTQGSPATVTITQPANAGFTPIAVTLGANAVASVNLTPYLSMVENAPANQVLNKGLLIRSTSIITAYYEQSSVYNPDIFSLKGNNALGTSFLVATQNQWNNNTLYTPPAPTNSFEIVATENNTQVTINPKAAIVGHPAGTAFTVTLNRGQTYSAVATGNLGSQHLAGSLVTATKPIAITTKDDFLTDAAYGTCSDLAGDQLVPVNLFGYKYISIHGFLNNPNDKVFIMGSVAATTVKVNGSAIGTVGVGDVISKASGGAPMYIEADKPVAVFHISGFGCEVGGALLPSVECTGSRNVGITRSDNRPIYLLLLVPAGGETSFTFNGSSTVIQANQFQWVPNTGNAWKYARIDVSGNLTAGSAAYISNSNKDFHLGIIHGDAGGGCRYGYFSDYKIFDAKAAAANAVCEGSSLQLNCNASATVGVSFSWTGPNGFTSNMQNPVIPNVSLTAAGTYTCTATRANCTAVTSSVSVTVSAGPVNTPGSNSPVCSGSALNLSGSNGPAGVTYQWTGPNGFSSTLQNPVISNAGNVAAGTYTLNMSYNGCTSSRNITVQVNPANTANASNNGPVCEGQQIQLQAGTNNSAATFSWTGPNGFVSNQQNPVISNAQSAAAGVYTLSVSSNSCATVTAATTVVINPGPGAAASGNGPLCEGQSLILTGTSSTAGVSFSWTGPNGFSSSNAGATIPNTTAANAGLYTLSVSKNGCTTTSTYQAQVFAKPVANPSANSPLCTGSNLQLSASGSGFSYAWTGPAGFTASIASPVINNVSASNAGIYQLKVSAPGCPDATANVSVIINPVPVANASSNSPLCSAAAIRLQAANTLAGSSFNWTGPAGFTAAIQNSVRSNANAGWGGDYILTTLLNGCSSSDTIRVTVNETPSAAISVNTPVCNGAVLNITNNNSLAGSTYSWAGPAGFTASTQHITNNSVSNAAAGWYRLTVSNAGCIAKDSVLVNVMPSPVLSFPAISDVCIDASPFLLSAAETSGIAGTGIYGAVVGLEPGNVFNPVVSGSGSKSIRYTYTAQNGCSSFADQHFTVYPLPIVNAGNDVNSLNGGAVTLTATCSTFPSVIQWQPAATLSNPSQLITRANPSGDMQYFITITDVNGCKGTDSVRVKVFSGVYVPNAFSPDNNGLHDRWIIPGLQALPNCEVNIYNRYGQLIYQSKGYTKPWDGTYKGIAQPPGAYVYLIKLNDGLRNIPLKGTVMLLR